MHRTGEHPHISIEDRVFVMRPVTDRVYRYWAEWRYRRLYGRACATGDNA